MSDRHNRVVTSGRSNRSARAEAADPIQSARRPATSGGIGLKSSSNGFPPVANLNADGGGGRSNGNGRDNNNNNNSSNNNSNNNNKSRMGLSAHEEAIYRRVNDPLSYWRPFSPPDDAARSNRLFAPMLPRSLDPTIPPVSPRKPPLHPPNCPAEWIAKSHAPAPFDAASTKFVHTSEEKVKVAREFIERNRGRLWKYDLRYMKKTPRTVCEDIVNDDNFLGLMSRYVQKERTLNLSSSDSTIQCLTYPEEVQGERRHTSSLRRSHAEPPPPDPFAASWTTSRSAREGRVRKLFQPAMEQRDTRHVRGFAHAPEFGTFSRYNSILKTNKGALLER